MAQSTLHVEQLAQELDGICYDKHTALEVFRSWPHALSKITSSLVRVLS